MKFLLNFEKTNQICVILMVLKKYFSKCGWFKYLGVGVLGEAGIEDGVGNLIAELVRVALVHGLRGEEEISYFSFLFENVSKK